MRRCLRHECLAFLFGGKRAAGASAGTSGVKVRAVESDAMQYAQLALKMSVINAQQTRVLQAATLRSVPLMLDKEYAKAILEANKEYGSRTKGQAGHGLGSPDPYNLVALAGVVVKQVVDEEPQKKLQDFINAMTPANSKAAQKTIRICRLEKMHDSKKKRLVIMIAGRSDIEDIILDALEKDGSSEWFGLRPAGFLERKAQEAIDEMI
eukprot:TRINITY_DN21413_c0_g1_i1.p1 TRINITY_DN21413_c0_g1~~TRINITY_DN21413_c0_g1_i1.p1  ORF type:complete len:209 (-),score=64.41 TRINITY_DN21413_c0_g1_i1:262-888(-)